MGPKFIVLFVAIVLAMFLLIGNTGVVSFRLFFWTLDMSLAVLVLVTLLIGFIVGFVAAKITGRSRKTPKETPPVSDSDLFET
jgi:uncharacterized integral membrane protein